MKDITSKELKELLVADSNIKILDVREAWEFDEGHIEGARNFSLYAIPNGSDEINDWKDSTIYIHCKSGNRSAKAQFLLNGKGFSDVVNLLGGFDDWKAN